MAVRTGIRLKVWKTNPIFFRRTSASLAVGRLVISFSSKKILPWLGLSRQPRRLRTVVFPEPEGPAIERNSPSSIEKEILVDVFEFGDRHVLLHLLKIHF
jgi:hypothetical protein